LLRLRLRSFATVNAPRLGGSEAITATGLARRAQHSAADHAATSSAARRTVGETGQQFPSHSVSLVEVVVFRAIPVSLEGGAPAERPVALLAAQAQRSKARPRHSPKAT
jgi:hypothetical protein